VWWVLPPKVSLLFLNGCLLLCVITVMHSFLMTDLKEQYNGTTFCSKLRKTTVEMQERLRTAFWDIAKQWHGPPVSDIHCSELLHTTLYKRATIRCRFRCNIPEQRRSHLLYGRSLKSCIVIYSLYFNLIRLTGRPCPIKGNSSQTVPCGCRHADLKMEITLALFNKTNLCTIIIKHTKTPPLLKA
jgi:hypothetical protein